jgi:hypothetical protein
MRTRLTHKKAYKDFSFSSKLDLFIFDWAVNKNEPKKVLNQLGYTVNPYNEELDNICNIDFYNRYEKEINEYANHYNHMCIELEGKPSHNLPVNESDKKKLARLAFNLASYYILDDWRMIYRYSK